MKRQSLKQKRLFILSILSDYTGMSYYESPTYYIDIDGSRNACFTRLEINYLGRNKEGALVRSKRVIDTHSFHQKWNVNLVDHSVRLTLGNMILTAKEHTPISPVSK